MKKSYIVPMSEYTQVQLGILMESDNNSSSEGNGPNGAYQRDPGLDAEANEMEFDEDVAMPASKSVW